MCKLEKSIYSLKQSGRNWNEMLHTCLVDDDHFTQNPTNHSVSTKESKEAGTEVVIIWVDDLIIAACNNESLEVKNMLSTRFKIGLTSVEVFSGQRLQPV